MPKLSPEDQASRFPPGLVTFDSRSVLIYRLALGGAGFFTSLSCLLRMNDFYGEEGLMDRALIEAAVGSTRWAPHFWFASDGWTTALYILAMLLSVGLAAGRWPRACAAVLVFLTASHNLRFPFAYGGFGSYLPWLFCTFFFLPSALLHTSFVAGTYLMAGSSKIGIPAWSDGSALINVFHSKLWSAPWVANILPQALLEGLSPAIPWLEIIFAAATMVSAFKFRWRGPLLGIALLFHITILFTLNVNDVTIMSLIAWIPFIPPVIFGRQLSRQRGADQNRCSIRWPESIAAALLVIGGIMILRPEWRNWSPWILVRRLGIMSDFAHFKHPRKSLVRPRFFGLAPGRRAEIIVPIGTVVDEGPQVYEDLFSSYFNRDRRWVKFLIPLTSPSKQRTGTRLFETFLCRRYGPTRESGFERFEWETVLERDDEVVARTSHVHRCPAY